MNPKFTVEDDGGQFIAKFGARDDIVDTPLIEAATMTLAAMAGIDAAPTRIERAGTRNCILVRRFDRKDGGVAHYLSAHSAWNRSRARPQQDVLTWASYPGIVQLMQHGLSASPKEDAVELFRRMVFNIVIGNSDDHGRNHGFLMAADGTWRRSEAFDVVPTLGAEATVQALGVGQDGRLRS